MRDLPRLHEITLVFIRHGLGDLVRRIGVASFLERAGAMLHWGEVSRSTRLETQQRLRLAFEELGPTFIKLGQMLSTREDLLPPEWTEELALAHQRRARAVRRDPAGHRTSARPAALRGIRRPRARTFGFRIDRPGAPCRLRDGREVVLKVRRPGIEAKIEADMRLLAHLARVIESEVPEARRYQPTRVVEEFAAR